jgi:hypothetical protein
MTYNDLYSPQYQAYELPTSPVTRAKNSPQAQPYYRILASPLLKQRSCLTSIKPAQTPQTAKRPSHALRQILYAESARGPFRLGHATTVISKNVAAKPCQSATTAASHSNLQRTSNATWALTRHHPRVPNSRIPVVLLALCAFATNHTPARTLLCVT